jgi:hypothetical protein
VTVPWPPPLTVDCVLLGAVVGLEAKAVTLDDELSSSAMRNSQEYPVNLLPQVQPCNGFDWHAPSLTQNRLCADVLPPGKVQ